jgi:hypothetical protein
MVNIDARAVRTRRCAGPDLPLAEVAPGVRALLAAGADHQRPAAVAALQKTSPKQGAFRVVVIAWRLLLVPAELLLHGMERHLVNERRGDAGRHHDLFVCGAEYRMAAPGAPVVLGFRAHPDWLPAVQRVDGHPVNLRVRPTGRAVGRARNALAR